MKKLVGLLIATIMILGLVMVMVLVRGRNVRFFAGEGQRQYVTELPSNSIQERALFIPDLVDMTEDGSIYELTVDESQFEFFEGALSAVKSYNNQGYLGKTIKLYRGSTVYPTVTNNLDEVTTVHWHGLEVSGANDGAAESTAIVQPGESVLYELAVDQQASTIWYHPHAMGFTASQAYEGLAGMIIIEDDNTSKLGLPTDYGVNDIPLVLQAKLFDSEGHLDMGISESGETDQDDEKFKDKNRHWQEEHQSMLGFEDGNGSNSSTTEGFAIITNGYYQPYLEVKNEVIRFRTLNGSNHGIFDVYVGDGTSVSLIGTDGGLLETPQITNQFEIAAGQRFEFILDLSSKKIGDHIEIMANNQVVLNLIVSEESENTAVIPDQFSEFIPYEDYKNQEITHTFELGRNIINDTPFDPSAINEEFVKDEVYYFEVKNDDDENHSFHIHNAQFLVVEMNGDKTDYKKIGWKDTIYLRPNETMILQVKFRFIGDYMYHCHILSHEEKGMMGKFRVIDDQ